MQQRDPSNPPGDRARRRSLFSGRSEPPSPPLTASLTPSAAERVEAVITAYQEMIQEQLDEGLRAIQHSANTLMHEIAAEVWRGAGGDKDAVGSTILHELSRDQAIRSLISHSDERFQALNARTGRLEDTMNMLAESIRGAREQLERGADALAGSSSSPIGIDEIKEQLAEMTRQVTSTFQTLADRDQVIAEAVHERIREHGELIARETARIAQAMESYVQQGVVAMGNLAGETDSEIKAISVRQQELMERLEQTIEGRMGQLGERVQSVSDHARQLTEGLQQTIADRMVQFGEQVQALSDREQELVGRLEQNVTGQMAELGEQLRLVSEREQELSDRLERTVDDHMGQLGEQMQLLYDRAAIATTSLHELVAGLGDQVGADTHAALAGLTTTIQERVNGLAQLVRSDSEVLRGEFVRRTTVLDEQLGRRLDEGLGHAMDQTLTVIDRNMIRMVDALEGHFEHLGAGVGDRAANAAELAIGARFDDVLARLHGAAEVIERGGSDARVALDEGFTAFDERFTALDERFTAFDQRFDGSDQRFAALAKLVRSDSERIAEQILADQDVTKQALRAMKELQASLPVEVVQMVEERFASLAESIERSNEMLAGRIDRMAETIGQRQNDDIQVVIDRMGDAMHALASLGKGGPTTTDPRIELG